MHPNLRQLSNIRRLSTGRSMNPTYIYWKTTFTNLSGQKDQVTKRFGFRWFEIRDVNGDRQFFLNGKRIVLRTSISWGYWPVNGIYPTPELAKKQILAAKSLGLNMLNFHRGIGQSIVLDYADELGLLYYEEPGGFGNPPHFDVGEYLDSAQTPEVMDLYYQMRREKVFRMIKRDRSHPSLVIYNLINERNIHPNTHDKQDIQDFHKFDETRIITFTSTQKFAELGYSAPREAHPLKMFMEPYFTQVKYQGWWDEHHAGGFGVYSDDLYKSPTDYIRYSDNKAEIIYYGEEGAVGAPSPYGTLAAEINKTGKKGWDGDDYLKLFNAYDRFLSEKGFRSAFPSVDSLTHSLASVSYYYQGRIIENVRINNTVDGYAVNGWEDEKLENHSAVVDCYRNFKADPSIISHYNQPLFVAVKLRNKVLQTGKNTIADFYLVNETSLQGNNKLLVKVSDNTGLQQSYTFNVKIEKNTYGQLLVKNVNIPVKNCGYTNITAVLQKGEKIQARGHDEVFAVKLDTSCITKPFLIADTGNVFSSFLKKLSIVSAGKYETGYPSGAQIILAGKINIPNSWPLRQQLLDWIMDGNILIIADGADKWMDYLKEKEVIDYHGKQTLGDVWYGGNFFVRKHPLFEGLPVNTAFNWEYQCLSKYSKNRCGFRLTGDTTVVGAQSDHQQELYSAVGIIPLGRGKIIYSTLDLTGALRESNSASVVAGKILLNYIKYAERLIK